MKIEHKVCDYCKSFIKRPNEQVEEEGKFYHKDCLQKFHAFDCTICKEKMLSNEIVKDYWGNQYHQRHAEGKENCQYCGRLMCKELTNGFMRYPQDHIICNLCSRSSITSNDEVLPIFKRLLLIFQDSGVSFSKTASAIRFAHYKDIQKLAKKSGSLNMMGALQEKRIMKAGKMEKKFEIYILFGLPKIWFFAILAYQMGRLWVSLNAKSKLNAKQLEGTCYLFTYTALQKSSNPMAKYITHQLMTSEDDVVGEGFRQAKQRADGFGLEKYLKSL